MGAWDYSALDNDPAFDVQYRWQEWTVKSSYTAKQATEQFIKYWGDAVKYGDAITNMEIIALLAIHLNGALAIPKKLRKIAIDAINRELVDEALNEWESPTKRKEALISLLNEINGVITPPKKPKFFKDPSLCYSNTPSALGALKKLSQKEKIDFYKDSDVPAFVKTLNRLFHSQIWEKDAKIYEQAHRERLMMLSWYLGRQLKMDKEDIHKMLSKSAKWPTP